MGTSKPLTIYVHPAYWDTPWVQELKAKGHVVAVLETNLQADLILAPNCARFVSGMEPFVESFLKGARAIKYGKEKS